MWVLRVSSLALVGISRASRVVDSIKLINMSDSSDLDTLKDWVNQLEAELSSSKRNLAHSADETQVYKEQLVQLQAQYTNATQVYKEELVQLQAQCTELKVENRHLTWRLNEQTAQPASPAAASQSEVVLLRQQLTEKDQVIAAQEEKHQALLKSISLHAAKPKDAAETLKAWQSESALRGPPAESDADSSNNPGPTTTFRKQTQHSDNGSKTLVTQGATKTPAERPASQSKSPKPRQEPKPSVQAPTGYAQVVASRRAEEPVLPRPGQAPVPISHEISARQETLRAEKREEVQKSVGRSQKPNRVGGFQSLQNAERRADTTVTPAPKQNIASSSDRGQSAPTEFILPKDRPSSSAAPKQNVAASSNRPQTDEFILPKDRPSSSVPKQNAATTAQRQYSPAESIVKKDVPSSSAPKPNVAAMTFQERLRHAQINLGAQQESSSVSKQNVAATTVGGQYSSAEFVLKEDLLPHPAPKQNMTVSGNRSQTAEFILKEDWPSSSASEQNVAATTFQHRLRQAEFNLKKNRPSSSAPRQTVAPEFSLKEFPPFPVPRQNIAASSSQARPHGVDFILKKDLPPAPVPKEKAIPVQLPSLKGTQRSVSRELTTPTDPGKINTQAAPLVNIPQIRGKSPHDASLSKASKHEPVKYKLDNGKDGEKPYFKALARQVPAFPASNIEAVAQKSDFHDSTPQRPLTEEPSSQVPTEDTVDTTKDVLSWASNTEAPGN